MSKKNIAEIYSGGDNRMESNVLNGATHIHEAIEQACADKYNRGREEHGPSWVGERGAVEAMDEVIDALVYLGLEQKALYFGFDPDEDEMSKGMKTQSDVLNKLIDDLRGTLMGIELFLHIAPDENNWKRIFP